MIQNILLLLFIFSISALADSSPLCTKYELESDERFEIKALGNDNFLTIYSKNFKMNFFLQCPNATNIYAKILENRIENKDDLLQVETNSKVADIKISNHNNQGYIKEIKFLLNNKILSSLVEENIIYINKNKNKDMLYQLSANSKNKSTLPLSFQCNERYFFNKYKLKSLSFENEKLDVEYISKSISKWGVRFNDINDENIVSWFTNCQKWVNLTQSNHLEELFSLDKQIALQASRTHKKSKILLNDLQESAIYNHDSSNKKLLDFTEAMNSLKTIEKNKSKHQIFNDINNIFYIKNDKHLSNKLDYILSYTQNYYYYDLLSNVRIGSFSDTSKFDLEFIPVKISIFSFSKNKDFLVIRLENKIKLVEKDTQFTIYKLSNSFCSSLNNEINDANKRISNKIGLVDYCYDKKFGNIYSKSKYSTKSNKYKQVKRYKAPIVTKEIVKNKGECKDVENGVFCRHISKEYISTHIKNNLKMPSLDDLVEKFDKEEFEGSTVYAPNDKYFFFDEDSGWLSRDESDTNTIDLILTR